MTEPFLPGAPPLTSAQLKALAHPLRFRMLEVLRTDGPATATSIGRVVGESSGTTSYHLRQLANAGLIIEDTERGSARDRWWRSSGRWSIDLELSENATTSADAATVLDETLAARSDRLQRWRAHSDRWAQPWREATMIAASQMALTPDEMSELGARLLAVIESYRNLDDQDRPGTERIAIHTDVFPIGTPHTESVEEPANIESPRHYEENGQTDHQDRP